MKEEIIVKLSNLIDKRDRYQSHFLKLANIARGDFSDREEANIAQALRWGHSNKTILGEFDIEKEDIQALAWSILNRIEPRIKAVEKEINLIKSNLC